MVAPATWCVWGLVRGGPGASSPTTSPAGERCALAPVDVRGHLPGALDFSSTGSLGPQHRTASPVRAAALPAWLGGGAGAPSPGIRRRIRREGEREEGEGEMEVRGRRGRAALEEEEAQEEGGRRRRTPVAPVAVVASG